MLIQQPLMGNSKPKPAPRSVLKLVIRWIVICVIVLAVAALWYFLTITSRIPNHLGIKIITGNYYANWCVCDSVNANDKSQGVWSTYTYDDSSIDPKKIEVGGKTCEKLGTLGYCNPLRDYSDSDLRY
jgi:hypothetical protein